MRSWLALLLATSVAPSSARADSGPGEDAGILRVCREGPAAAAARAIRARGDAEVTAAGVLPNPDLVVEHQRALGDGADDRETVLGLRVPLRLSGRRGLLEDAARARADGARADAADALLEQVLEYRAAYAAAVLDDARVAVLEAQQRALDGLSATIGALAKGGEAAGFDRLRQETEARAHRRALASARASAAAARATLEVWLGPVATLSSAELPTLSGSAELARRAGAEPPTTPAMRGLEAASRASALEADAARRRWIPDLDVFAGYRAATATTETSHGVSLALTVPLTFFDHGQGEAARANAERAVTDATLAQLRRTREGAAKAAEQRLLALATAGEDVARAATSAQSVEDAATRLYTAGELSIAELLDAFRAAEDAKLAELALAEEAAAARIALMRARGTLFDSGLDEACGLKTGGSRR
jgi:cobalt-zinc-cadmium efflux system outer membrane protein